MEEFERYVAEGDPEDDADVEEGDDDDDDIGVVVNDTTASQTEDAPGIVSSALLERNRKMESMHK